MQLRERLFWSCARDSQHTEADAPAADAVGRIGGTPPGRAKRRCVVLEDLENATSAAEETEILTLLAQIGKKS